MLADLYDGRKWASLFDDILEEEQTFAVSTDVIQKWHTIIQYTIHYRPSWLIWGGSYARKVLFGIPNSTLYNWSYLLPRLAHDPLFQNHLRRLLKHLEDQLSLTS